MYFTWPLQYVSWEDAWPFHISLADWFNCCLNPIFTLLQTTLPVQHLGNTVLAHQSSVMYCSSQTGLLAVGMLIPSACIYKGLSLSSYSGHPHFRKRTSARGELDCSFEQRSQAYLAGMMLARSRSGFLPANGPRLLQTLLLCRALDISKHAKYM